MGFIKVAVHLFVCLALLPRFRAQISTPFGDVKGVACEEGVQGMQYLGIPFAAPPVGALRYRPPVKFNRTYPDPYLPADVLPFACPQTVVSGMDLPPKSEDCLYLNIWAPVNATPGTLPVRVSIHGGGFTYSSASDLYLNACAYVENTQTVHVNIQYRLGALGFYAHPEFINESGVAGNWGIMDMVMALEWIQENIYYFGGDPSKVLLHGGSSGAVSVVLLVSMDSNEGLFSSAIAQSPPGFTAKNLRGVPLANIEQAYAVSQSFLVDVGCDIGDVYMQIECMRNVSVEDLLAYAPGGLPIIQPIPKNQGFYPYVDGILVKKQIVDSFSNGSHVKVPLMIGTVLNEARYPFSVSTDARNITYSDINYYLQEIYPGVDPSPIIDMYNYSRYEESNSSAYFLVSDIWTDIFFACPTYNLLLALSANKEVPLFSYYFTHVPKCGFYYAFTHSAVDMGCTHGDDIYYEFYQTKNLPPPNGTCSFTDDEMKIVNYFASGWSTMNKYGKPSFENGTVWVQWDPTNQLKTVLDYPSDTREINFAARCSYYNELYMYKYDVAARPLATAR